MKLLDLDNKKSAPGGEAKTRREENDLDKASGKTPSTQLQPDIYEGAPWPSTLSSEAFHGLAGQIVHRIEPHSEADPAALLVTLLVAFGNIVGRRPYWIVESTTHYSNEFAVIVGDSSTARKGTSLDRILSLFKDHELDWLTKCQASGLVSGEGLIFPIRDPKLDEEGETLDEGSNDKRLFVSESEFASVLSAASRKECTLSPVLRNAWDGKTLRTLAKGAGKGGDVATAPHVSIIAHITLGELKARLAGVDQVNGFANRFLWVCARRSKFLPHGGSLRLEDCRDLTELLRARVDLASTRGEMPFTGAAAALWESLYPKLTAGTGGPLGSITSRAVAHVRRLALIYALLDGTADVDVHHLQAGLTVWDYCFASAEHIFGGLSPLARDLYEQLRQAFPGELSRSDLHHHQRRHASAEKLTRALEELKAAGLVSSRRESTSGAPKEQWIALAK